MLEQDILNPLVLQIIRNFPEELSKYKSKHITSAIWKWLREQGVGEPAIINMKNNDLVISERGVGEKHIKGPSIIQYKDKTFYIGYILESKRSGFGCRTFSGSQLVYAGGYQEDLKTGLGRLYSLKLDRFVFKGEYANDFRNGHGHLEKEDGGIYDGNYTNDKMQDFGVMTWANGDHYEGNFNNDLKVGKGKMTWANGDSYQGDFVLNSLNGKGKYTWKNGEHFEGEFKDGVMGGKGVMDYTSAINIKGSGADVHSIRQLKFDVVGDTRFASKNQAH